jgi:hypothetical protein
MHNKIFEQLRKEKIMQNGDAMQQNFFKMYAVSMTPLARDMRGH